MLNQQKSKRTLQSLTPQKKPLTDSKVQPLTQPLKSRKSKGSNSPSRQSIKMTEEQIQQAEEKKLAIKRLSQLQECSVLSQDKKSSLLLQSVVLALQKEILSSSLQIGSLPHQLANYLRKSRSSDKSDQKQSNHAPDQEYRALLQKKQLIIQQLREMQQDQNQLRKRLTQTTLNSSALKLNKMPELKQETKEHWKKIRQIVKEHELNSQKMRELNKIKLQEQLLQHIQLEDHKRKELSEQRRKSIQNKILDIQNRRKERTQRIKESEVIVEKLQKRTKLFQKMETNWSKLQSELKRLDEAASFEKHTARRLVSMRQIKRYEQEHDQKFLQQQQKRRLKLQQSRPIPLNPFQKSKFSVDVLEQAKKKKQMEEQKILKIKELMDKKREYATHLKQKYQSMVRLDPKRNKSDQEHTKKQTRSMTAFDIRNKGNQYMRTINEGVSTLKTHSQSKTSLKKLESEKKQYKNYLPEVLKNLIGKGLDPLERNLQMINAIMNKQTSTEQKFFQAQIIMNKIESGGKQKDILNSINAKIEILKRLSYKNQ